MNMELTGKVAVITGGSIGIGYAVAEGFAREGASIAICARNADNVARAAERLGTSYDIPVLGFAADVTKPDDIRSFLEAVEKQFDGADILVNNAGTGSAEKIAEAEDEKWQYYWDLHLMAAVRMSRGLIPAMRRRGGGVILNTASICAKQPLGYEPIYNVTKSALVMFSKCLADEVIADNIRVNCINPGLVLTPDWRKTATLLGKEQGISADEYLDRIAKQNAPIGRFASPEEIANLFVFLSSPKASYCIGSTYYIDGGWLKTIE